jgi:hypothetical protein
VVEAAVGRAAVPGRIAKATQWAAEAGVLVI